MKAALRRKRRLVQLLCQRSIDPSVQVIARVDLILACFSDAGYGSLSEAFEAREAQRAVFSLVGRARNLNQMKLWKHLRIPRAHRCRVRKTTQEQRAEVLFDLHKSVRDGCYDRASVVAAMYCLQEVVTSMREMFAVGRVMNLDEIPGASNGPHAQPFYPLS